MGPPPGPPRRGGAGPVIAAVAGGLVVLLVAVVAVVVVLSGNDEGEGGGGSGPQESPRPGAIAGGAQARIGADGGLEMARPGVERPVVDIYEDFACPPCGRFDREHDPMLKQLVVNGDAKVVFHPMVIFSPGQQPMHGNALRAASALRCVSDGARWLTYQDTLYNHQPASEGITGYRVDDLVSYGRSSGLAGGDFERCVRTQRHASSVLEVSRGYVDDGVQGTPAVRIKGRTLNQSETADSGALRSAILGAS